MTKLTVAFVTTCNDGNPIFSMSGVLFIIVRTLDIGKCMSFDLEVFDLFIESFGSVLVVETKTKYQYLINFQLQIIKTILTIIQR